MKKTLLLFVITALFATMAWGETDLWESALSLFEENAELVPGKMDTHFQETDHLGKVLNYTKSRLTFFLDDEGEVDSQLVSAEKDGKDITKERQEERKKEREKPKDQQNQGRGGFSMENFESPFDPALQNRVMKKKEGKYRLIEGKNCVNYHFVMAKKKDDPESVAIKGTAWLDYKTGAPIQIEYTFDPLPDFVSEMKIIIVYHNDENSWYPKRVEFTGTGGLLFLQKFFRVTMTLSDYFLRNS